MNEVMIFSNEDFGPVRTIWINDKPYFCGSDVAKSLGYAKPRNAIEMHCKGALKQGVGVVTGKKADGSSAVQTVSMTFIPEGGVFRLITHSRLPSVQKFESWVFDEVIPTIVRTGKYDIQNSEIITEKDRQKSKEVRSKFTGTLKEYGYTAKHEYIQTTVQMKKSLGITCKKDQMDKKELLKVEAAETVESSLEAHNSKHIA